MFSRYLPTKGDLVDFRSGGDPDRPNLMHTVEGKDIWLIHNYKLLPAGNREEDRQPPGTPSSSSASSSTSPPRPPTKRASSPVKTSDTPPPTPSATPYFYSAGPSAKRSLFHSNGGPSNASAPQGGANKATHLISDLNPYQNKYTIRARCTNKGDLQEKSSSRYRLKKLYSLISSKRGSRLTTANALKIF